MNYMVFDVESMGLHGEAFAVGYVVVDPAGKELECGCFACDRRKANPGILGDVEWVDKNVPVLRCSHTTRTGFKAAFWSVWKKWKSTSTLAADCAWPVEARFLMECVDDDRDKRNWEGPYPLIDIGSVLLASGKDPIGKFERKPNELPEHDPLCDARQSARILIECLNRV